MVIDMNYWTKVLKKILIFVLTLMVIFVVFKLAVFYMPFLVAFVISLMLEPIIKFLMKKVKFKRKTSAIIAITFVICIIVGLLAWGITTIITEGYNLLENLGTYMSNITGFINKIISSENLQKLNIPSNIIEIIKNLISNSIDSATTFTNNFLKGILEWLTQVPTIGIYLMVTFLSLYLICTDKVYILDQIEHHLPEKWSRKLFKHMKEIIKSLGGYLKAEATLIFISFVISVVRTVYI